jgi:hypothetical protein
MALGVFRCGAQNSDAIGGTADIAGSPYRYEHPVRRFVSGKVGGCQPQERHSALADSLLSLTQGSDFTTAMTDAYLRLAPFGV